MSEASSGQVTELLLDWGGGNRKALDQLIPLVYTELQRLARSYMRRENPGHTLQTGALVNQAYLKLVDQKRVKLQNRAHFFGVSAQLMRRILVDHARRKRADKRGGGQDKLAFDEAIGSVAQSEIDLPALDDALKELEQLNSRQSRVVELKYFVGLSIEEIADMLEVSEATISREWSSAKAWLGRELSRG